MNAFLVWFAGKKTYIGVAIGIIVLLAENVLGIDVPGAEPSDGWFGTMMALLGIGTLSAKIERKLPEAVVVPAPPQPPAT